MSTRFLYLITDGGPLRKSGQLSSVIQGIVSAYGQHILAIQVREQVGRLPATDNDVLELGSSIRSCLRDYGVKLIISRRLDLAVAIGADAVHLGFTLTPEGYFDLSELHAAHQAGLEVGVSVHSLDEAIAADRGAADYLLLSPVFPTISKSMDGRLALSPAGVSAIRQQVKGPLIGLGGIDSENFSEVMSAGADAVAVIGSVFCASDPLAAIASFVEARKRWR